MLYGVAVAILWAAATVHFSARSYRRVSDLQRMTHAWYKATYPQAMKGTKTCCFGCGSDRMAIRNLLQQTFHREHVCVDCGTTLYYSPERT